MGTGGPGPRPGSGLLLGTRPVEVTVRQEGGRRGSWGRRIRGRAVPNSRRCVSLLEPHEGSSGPPLRARGPAALPDLACDWPGRQVFNDAKRNAQGLVEEVGVGRGTKGGLGVERTRGGGMAGCPPEGPTLPRTAPQDADAGGGAGPRGGLGQVAAPGAGPQHEGPRDPGGARPAPGLGEGSGRALP